jgi:hypothetical protein
MLPETLAHLKEHNFLRGDHPDRDGLADGCLGLLLERPVETADEDEIQAKALIVPELRYRLLGAGVNEDVERELEMLLGPLVSLKPEAKVQDKLENGFVLCAKSVTRKLGNNGEGTITINRKGRFVTSVPELIEQYFWLPQYERLTRDAEGLNKRLELGTRRQPALNARRQPMISQAHEKLQLELPLQTS